MASAQILAFPFALAMDGTIATVPQGSDIANAQQIAALIYTIEGERPMAPGFGINDTAFSGIKPGIIAAKVALYGPNVDIDSVTATQVSETHSDVTVAFT